MAFTPEDLTLATAKATQGFVATTDKPTDKYIVNIRKVLTPVLMKVKPYDQLNNQNSLAGVILTEDCYMHIYKQGPYVFPLVVSVYDFTINANAEKRSSRERNWRMNPRLRPSALRCSRHCMCQLHHIRRQREVVQGTGRCGQVLHKRDRRTAPRTPRGPLHMATCH